VIVRDKSRRGVIKVLISWVEVCFLMLKQGSTSPLKKKKYCKFETFSHKILIFCLYTALKIRYSSATHVNGKVQTTKNLMHPLKIAQTRIIISKIKNFEGYEMELKSTFCGKCILKLRIMSTHK